VVTRAGSIVRSVLNYRKMFGERGTAFLQGVLLKMGVFVMVFCGVSVVSLWCFCGGWRHVFWLLKKYQLFKIFFFITTDADPIARGLAGLFTGGRPRLALSEEIAGFFHLPLSTLRWGAVELVGQLIV
jgi:hypothetical protein